MLLTDALAAIAVDVADQSQWSIPQKAEVTNTRTNQSDPNSQMIKDDSLSNGKKDDVYSVL